MDSELAIVRGQKAYVAALSGKRADAVDLYQDVLAANLQSDVATHALCANNVVVLRSQLAESPPPVRPLPGVVVSVHCMEPW